VVASIAARLASEERRSVPTLADALAVMATALALASNSNLPDSNSSRSRLFWKKIILAIRLAAGLQSDTQLRHRRVTDESVMHIHMTLTSRTGNVPIPAPMMRGRDLAYVRFNGRLFSRHQSIRGIWSW